VVRVDSIGVADDSEAEHEGEPPPLAREDVAAILTEVRSALLRVIANNHHPERIVTLPASAVDATVRAQDEVAEACQQMLNNWDSMTGEKTDQSETP
jgi:hypothetical protein